MDDKRYNGWTNYETWNVALWMDNDSADYWDKEAQQVHDFAKADGIFAKEDRATLDFADLLKDFHEETRPIITGTYGDLLNAAMSHVNWHEIAKHYIDGVKNNVEVA